MGVTTVMRAERTIANVLTALLSHRVLPAAGREFFVPAGPRGPFRPTLSKQMICQKSAPVNSVLSSRPQRIGIDSAPFFHAAERGIFARRT